LAFSSNFNLGAVLIDLQEDFTIAAWPVARGRSGRRATAPIWRAGKPDQSFAVMIDLAAAVINST